MDAPTDERPDPMNEARAAISAALRAAGPRRHILLADFALRLARLGHVTEVRVSVAGGTPLDAIRIALAEPAVPPEAAEAAPGETTPAGAIGVRGGNGGSDPLQPLPKRNRACPECGRDLRQDGRQAKRRVFCSVRCRVRHHRARAVSKVGAPGPAQSL